MGASCKVKLGYDLNSNRKVAVKIMKDNLDDKMKKLILTEVAAMTVLQHPNVVQQVEFGEDVYVKDSGKVRHVSYIVLELAQGGEIFDYIANSGRFEEKIARFFFR
jgi:serine/threonine protein kinase